MRQGRILQCCASLFLIAFILVVSALYLFPIGCSVNRKIFEGSDIRPWSRHVDSAGDVTQRDNLILRFQRMNKYKMSRKRLPSIIGIGAEKCGTGWFQFALSHHPMIRIGKEEVHFFDVQSSYLSDMEYYRNLMVNATEDELVMEKSPSYFNFNLKVANRIKYSLPDVKLWLILCDPTHRTYSDFIHEEDLKNRRFGGSFEEYVNQYVTMAKMKLDNVNEESLEKVVHGWHVSDRDSHILTMGVYYHSLMRWLGNFDLNQIFITSGEELEKNTGKIVEEFQDYFNIPKMLLEEDFVRSPDTGLYCIVPRVVTDGKVIQQPRKCYEASQKGFAKGRTRSNSTKNKASSHAIEILRTFFNPYDNLLFNLLNKKLW